MIIFFIGLTEDPLRFPEEEDPELGVGRAVYLGRDENILEGDVGGVSVVVLKADVACL